MIKRLLVPLALLALAALAVTACGGGGSSAEDEVTEVIEQAATTSAINSVECLKRPFIAATPRRSRVVSDARKAKLWRNSRFRLLHSQYLSAPKTRCLPARIEPGTSGVLGMGEVRQQAQVGCRSQLHGSRCVPNVVMRGSCPSRAESFRVDRTHVDCTRDARSKRRRSSPLRHARDRAHGESGCGCCEKLADHRLVHTYS